MIRPLSPEFVRGNLDALIAISADVSPWGETEFLSDLPGKWALSFALWPNAQRILSLKFGPPHIHQFMVAPAIRNCGVGTRMLREAIGRGAATLKVERANSGAIRFYRRHGWADLRDSGQYLWMRWG